jgi:hypothetical protein
MLSKELQVGWDCLRVQGVRWTSRGSNTAAEPAFSVHLDEDSDCHTNASPPASTANRKSHLEITLYLRIVNRGWYIETPPFQVTYESDPFVKVLADDDWQVLPLQKAASHVVDAILMDRPNVPRAQLSRQPLFEHDLLLLQTVRISAFWES